MKGDPVYGAHCDNVNQVYSMIGVIGTLGTADTAGSANTLPIGVEETTGAMYVYNVGPAGTTTPAGTQDVNVVSGTVVTSMGDLTGGTLDIITDGTIGIKGTVPVSGTVTTSMGDLTGGTIDQITSGSIAVTAGTVASVGTVPGIGTITNLGTVGTITGAGVVTTVSNITNGTIRVAAGTVIVTTGTINSGTINAGTINAATINTGTINIGSISGRGANAAATVGFPVLTGGMDSGGTAYSFLVDTTRRLHNVIEIGTINAATINAGTIDLLKSGTVAVSTPGTITSGSIAVTAGSIVGTVSVNTPGTITSGSIAVTAGTMIITKGTIEAGTINAGTIKNDGRPARNLLSYATSVALAGTAYGTVIGSAGAGTSIWVNDVSIINEAGTVTCAVGFGTENSGTAVLWRGLLGPREGIQKSYPLAVNCGMTNKDLTVYALQAATIDVAVSYFISV
jgi:lipopolysaccharide export system protein LptA